MQGEMGVYTDVQNLGPMGSRQAMMAGASAPAAPVPVQAVAQPPYPPMAPPAAASSPEAKAKVKGLIVGVVLTVTALVLSIIFFSMIIAAPTSNLVARDLATPDGRTVELEEGKYDVWGPEWLAQKPLVWITAEGGEEVFRTVDTGVDTNVQGYTKLGSFECKGGTYRMLSDMNVEVVISKPTGLLCGSTITLLIIMMVAGLYTFITLIRWSKERARQRPRMPYPPQYYQPPQQPRY